MYSRTGAMTIVAFCPLFVMSNKPIKALERVGSYYGGPTASSRFGTTVAALNSGRQLQSGPHRREYIPEERAPAELLQQSLLVGKQLDLHPRRQPAPRPRAQQACYRYQK